MFEVEIVGPPGLAVYHQLCHLVGAAAVRTADRSVVVSVVDQAALVAVLARLNDLGLVICGVSRERCR